MKHNLGDRFSLIVTDSAQSALSILEKTPVAVLLTDQRMPGMSGVDLAERVLQLYPDVIRVIITAYSDLEATVDAINRAQVNRFIKKPWTREELVAVLQESIVAYYTGGSSAHAGAARPARPVTSLAIMASSIAHDLRQPLAYIEPALGMLRGDALRLFEMNLSPPEATERVASVLDGLEDVRGGWTKIKLIVETLLRPFVRIKTRPEVIDVRRLVESAVLIARGTISTPRGAQAGASG